MSWKGLIDIYILEILENYSSKYNRLRQKDIISYLDRDYNIDICRNTVSKYLTEMREQGYIEGNRGMYSVRRFTNSEINILINSLVYSKTIPIDNIRSIIKKLNHMLEPEMRNMKKTTYFLNSIEHTDNKNIFDIIDKIYVAIEKRKKIEITSCKYNIYGSVERGGKKILDPYYIVAEKSKYYLLCNSGRGDIEPRRIDRIKSVKVLNERRCEICQMEKYRNKTFNLQNYMREHIYMYSGDNDIVTLKILKNNIGDFIDWYGKDYTVKGEDKDFVVIRVRANVNAVYFWALQYGGIAEVIKPDYLREKIRKGAKAIYDRYNNGL